MRVGITGAPGTGKTQLSRQYTSVLHCDDFIDLGWSECSQHCAGLLDSGMYDTFEGVQLPRALRKWLQANPKGKPLDHLIVLTKVHRPHTKPGQAAMGKGVHTVLDEILPELKKRGVTVERRT